MKLLLIFVILFFSFVNIANGIDCSANNEDNVVTFICQQSINNLNNMAIIDNKLNAILEILYHNGSVNITNLPNVNYFSNGAVQNVPKILLTPIMLLFSIIYVNLFK